MSVEALLTQEGTLCRLAAVSRKRVLQEIANSMCNEDLSVDDLFDRLMARERLGSTGIGHGVAIPHCRANVESMSICLVTTDSPVDYEADDGERVDIFVVLIVPNDEHQAHLDALAQFSRVLAEEPNRLALRACTSSDELNSCMRSLLAS